jgi:hypothetical protein
MEHYWHWIGQEGVFSQHHLFQIRASSISKLGRLGFGQGTNHDAYLIHNSCSPALFPSRLTPKM